jgi:hypothetical protein
MEMDAVLESSTPSAVYTSVQNNVENQKKDHEKTVKGA